MRKERLLPDRNEFHSRLARSASLVSCKCRFAFLTKHIADNKSNVRNDYLIKDGDGRARITVAHRKINSKFK